MTNNLKIYLSEKDILKQIELIADSINKDYSKLCNYENPLHIICILSGAFMFCSDLVKKLKIPIKISFIKLSSYGESTKSSGNVDVIDINLPNLNGKNVLIIDDIIDTGLTLDFFIKNLNSLYNLNSVKTAVLLDKRFSRKVNLTPDYKAFDIKNEFVVGYGMDYKGLYRNLSYIGYFDDI